MLTISERTKPFVAKSLAELVNELSSACVPNGYYYFCMSMSPDDTERFDSKIIKEIEAARWRFRGEGLPLDVKYLRLGRSYVVMARGKAESFFDMSQPRTGDIRVTPLFFDGYQIACKGAQIEGGYLTTVELAPDMFEHRKFHCTRLALKDSASEAGARIKSTSEVRSPEIWEQLEEILLAVNKERSDAGLDLVSRADVGLGEGVVIPLASKDEAAAGRPQPPS